MTVRIVYGFLFFLAVNMMVPLTGARAQCVMLNPSKAVWDFVNLHVTLTKAAAGFRHSQERLDVSTAETRVTEKVDSVSLLQWLLVSRANYKASFFGSIRDSSLDLDGRRQSDGANPTLRGTAKLQLVDVKSDRTVLIPDFDVALTDPQWQETGEKALLGLTEDRATVLHVPSGNTLLSFNWSAQGTVIPGGYEFRFRFPPSTVQRLNLVLPEGLEPHVSDAVTDAVRIVDDSGWKEWLVILASHGETVVRLMVRQEMINLAEMLFVQESIFELEESGMQWISRLELHVLGQSVKELIFRIPGTLNVSSVTLHQRGIDVAPVELQGESMPNGIYRVRIPDPLLGTAEILFHGTGQLLENTTWDIPKIMLMKGVWQQEMVRLVVARPLQVTGFEMDRVSQISWIETAGPPSGETLDFQFHDPEGSLNVQLRSQTAELTSTVIHEFLWSEEQIEVTTVIEWAVLRGQVFQVRSRLPDFWEVVEVTVQQLMEDGNWQTVPDLLRRWTVISSESEFSELHMELSRSANAQRPLRTAVRMRNLSQFDPDEFDLNHVFEVAPLGAEQVEMGLFFELTDTYRYSLSPLDEDLIITAPEARDLWKDRFVHIPENALIIRKQPGRGSLPLFRSPVRKQFSAEVEVTSVILRQREIHHRVDLHCKIDGTDSVRQILIYFPRRSSAGSYRWKMVNDAGDLQSTEPVLKRRLQNRMHVLWGLPQSGELWEIQLSEIQFENFRLVGEQFLQGTDSIDLELPVLPQVLQQQNLVWLYALENIGMDVRAEKVNCLIANWKDRKQSRSLLEWGEGFPAYQGQLLGVWSYEDLQSRLQVFTDSYSISTVGHQQKGICSRAEMRVVLHPGWEMECQVRFYLSEDFEGKFQIQLPEEVQLIRTSINGRVLSNSPLIIEKSVENQVLRVHLDEGAPSQIVEIQYRCSAASSEGIRGKLSVFEWRSHSVIPFPQLNCSVLRFQCNMQVPAGYELFANPVEFATVKNQRKQNWSQRLFGAIGRSGEMLPFNPAESREWKKLWDNGGFPSSRMVSSRERQTPVKGGPIQHWEEMSFSANDLPQKGVFQWVHRDFRVLVSLAIFFLGMTGGLLTCYRIENAWRLGLPVMIAMGWTVMLFSDVSWLTFGLQNLVMGLFVVLIFKSLFRKRLNVSEVHSGSTVQRFPVPLSSWMVPLIGVSLLGTPPVPVSAMEAEVPSHILSSAAYVGRVSEGFLQLTASYRIHVRPTTDSGQISIPIPLDYRTAGINAIYLRKGEQPYTEIAALPDQENMVIRVGGPGDYQLRLSLAPSWSQSETGQIFWRCAIPRLSQSKLDLKVNHNEIPVVVRDVRGAIVKTVHDDYTEIKGELGNISELVVFRQAATETARVSVRQFMLFDLVPRRVIRVWFRYEISGGMMSRLYWRMDPRLRVPVVQSDGQVLRINRLVTTSSTDPWITVDLGAPKTGLQFFYAEFEERETGGITDRPVGQLRVPYVLPRMVDEHEGLFAIGNSGNMRAEILGKKPEELVARNVVTEFMSDWEGLSLQPLEDVVDGGLPWQIDQDPINLSIRTPVTSSRADQVLALVVHPRHVDLMTRITVIPTETTDFSDRLRLSPEIKVESVVVEELQTGDSTATMSSVLRRWVRNEKGEIILLLNDAMTLPYTIQLRGVLSRDRNSANIPYVILEDVTLGAGFMWVYGNQSHVAELINLRGMVEMASPADSLQFGAIKGHLDGAYRLTELTYDATIRVSPRNKPLSAEMEPGQETDVKQIDISGFSDRTDRQRERFNLQANGNATSMDVSALPSETEAVQMADDKLLAPTDTRNTVVLSDIAINVDWPNRLLGRRTLFMGANASSHLELEKPSGVRITNILIDGVKQTVEESSQHKWTIPLVTTGFQNIEIRWEGSFEDAVPGERLRLEVPKITSATVKQSMWTLYWPSDWGKPRILEGAEWVSSKRVKMETVKAWLDQSQSLLAKNPPLPRSFLDRVLTPRFSRISRFLDVNASETDPDIMQIQETFDQVSAVASLSPEMMEGQRVAVSGKVQKAISLDKLEDVNVGYVRTVSASNEGLLEFQFERPDEGLMNPDNVLLVIIIWIGMALWFLGNRFLWSGAGQAILCVAMLSSLGLTWWLWFTPSVLGPCLIILSPVVGWRTFQTRAFSV